SAGDVEKFIFLLQRGANVNAKSIQGWTPLTVASQNGHWKIVKILLDQGAAVNVQDNRGYSPLMNAAHNGHAAIAELLLEWGVEVDLKNKNNGGTALYFAAQQGNLDSVELLLKNGAGVNLQSYDKGTALHVAAQLGHNNVVKLLLENGASLNARNGEGMTALMLAVYYNHKDIVQFLLSKGADINIKDEGGRIALDDAKELGYKDIENLLNSFKTDNRGGQSSSPIGFFQSKKAKNLVDAVRSGKLRVVRKLLEQGADPNVFEPNDNLGYPLHYALNESPEMVQLLIDFGADINVMGRGGATPLAKTQSRGLSGVAAVLRSAGAELHSSQDEFWMDPVFRLQIQKNIGQLVLLARMHFPTANPEEIVEKVESKLDFQFPQGTSSLEQEIMKKEM
ncbi:ankyrin repeat domain-containing protein, partial [bacterium]|nr:ankyrin repeat domain-containing protein [bacterium]